jgi:adenylate kinase family enzyme
MARICITGSPRAGKTTYAKTLGIPVKHTDDLIATHGWSEASQAASEWLNEPGPWCIEGTAVARALRKWIAAHPEGKPCDKLILLWEPHWPLSKGQHAMAKGVDTVFQEICAELLKRGVEIEQRAKLGGAA